MVIYCLYCLDDDLEDDLEDVLEDDLGEEDLGQGSASKRAKAVVPPPLCVVASTITPARLPRKGMFKSESTTMICSRQREERERESQVGHIYVYMYV